MTAGETVPMAKMLGRAALWGSGCSCWDCCGMTTSAKMRRRRRTVKQREKRMWLREANCQ